GRPGAGGPSVVSRFEVEVPEQVVPLHVIGVPLDAAETDPQRGIGSTLSAVGAGQLQIREGIGVPRTLFRPALQIVRSGGVHGQARVSWDRGPLAARGRRCAVCAKEDSYAGRRHTRTSAILIRRTTAVSLPWTCDPSGPGSRRRR